MNMKRNSKRRIRESTHYSGHLVSQMRNADYLETSLSAGSKNRLGQYMRNLAVTRGVGGPNLDVALMHLLKEYAINKPALNQQISYLRDLVDEDGYAFSRNLKIYSTTEEAMERFAATDYTSFRWNLNYRKSLKELKEEFSKLRLTPLSYSSDDEIRDTLPKLDTHSGYYWILSGKKKKGDNMEGIHGIFAQEMKCALDRGSFSRPILIGFRTQASGEYEDDGSQTGKCKHKLRVVSMIDILVIIAELMFARPIQDYLARVNYYAGGKSETEISSIITNWRVRFDKFLSIDYSSYDQTISSWLIEDAFEVIKSAFVLNKEQSVLFDVIVHDFIHKDFILSEGVLHSDKGVPSGSMFTQIIDSIVNVLVVRTFFNSIKAKAEMIVMGDDNAIFTSADIDIEELASYLSKNFGLIVKTDDKSNQGNTKKDDVKFLSRYWRWDGQWRHPNQLISRMLYPERVRNYENEVGPEHVMFAFFLTYRLGMEQLIDTKRFLHDYPISKQFIMNNVDSRYLPGALAYIREYT